MANYVTTEEFLALLDTVQTLTYVVDTIADEVDTPSLFYVDSLGLGNAGDVDSELTKVQDKIHSLFIAVKERT